MKPWIIIAGLSLFLLATLAACTAPTGEQLPTVAAFTWETYSDAAGSFTMEIPDYLPLELVEVDKDGKSSLHRWSVWTDEGALFAVEVLARYKDPWRVSSEETARHNFANITGLYGKRMSVRHIEQPRPRHGGWAYTVEVDLLDEQNPCRIRTTDYYDDQPDWTYFATTKICVGENMDYYLDGRKAIFSLTPTP